LAALTVLGLTRSAAEGRWCRTAKRDAILYRLPTNDRAAEICCCRFADRRLISHSNVNHPPASFKQRVKHTDTVAGDALLLLLLNRCCLRRRRLLRSLPGDLIVSEIDSPPMAANNYFGFTHGGTQYA